MRGTTMDEIERPYDGCGKCLLGVRRLSRVKAAATSPERQREDVLTAAAAIGGHIIDWADDWEVSGATDPMTRPKLGPWLRDERGKYDGLVAAAVDRLGRIVVDCLSTGYKMRDEGKLLVSYGHEGVWDLDDPNDENRFTMEACIADRAVLPHGDRLPRGGASATPERAVVLASRSTFATGPSLPQPSGAGAHAPLPRSPVSARRP